MLENSGVELAEAQAHRRQLFLDFKETGHAEVLDAHQFGFGLHAQVADGLDVEEGQGLAGSDRRLPRGACCGKVS